MSRERVLQAYIVLVGCSAVVVLAGCVAFAASMTRAGQLGTWAAAVVFLVLGVVSSGRKVSMGESSSHHMGTVAYVAALIVLPFPMSVLVIGLSKGVSQVHLLVKKQRRWRNVVVNVGATVLSSAAGGQAYQLCRGDHYLWNHGLSAVEAFPALIILGLLYFGIEGLVVVGAITLLSRESLWPVFVALFKDTFLGETSLIFIGVVLAVLYHANPVLSLFTVIPVMFSLRAFESVRRLRDETVAAVLKLAESIDYRDTGTYEHSRRIAEMTRRLAESLGLMPEHVSQIVLASRVHDLGKIGISNDILLKQGPLDPGQRQIMQDHPVIGATILSSYSAFKDSVDIVKHHHERWDGNGYPDGLKGESIPIGSRIIAVVDAFDSMTADRPYRKGMPVYEAVERLKDGIGSQFDPKICAQFIDILIVEGKYEQPEPIPAIRVLPTINAAS